MKIYICEQESLSKRLSDLSAYDGLPTPDMASVSIGDGYGKYGTLKGEIKGSTGIIYIDGFLNSDGPSLFDAFFGRPVTGYSDVIDLIDTMVDSGVSRLRFAIDSPGGEIGIIDNLWVKIKSLNMETVATVSGMCASGGYYIASACDSIISTNPLAVFGSIGVVVSGVDYTCALEKDGIKIVHVVSENAEKKRLGIDTEEGRDELKKFVTQAERQFIGRISEGRNLSIDHIQDNFGRGFIMHALDYNGDGVDALSVGMIDSVLGYEKTNKDETNKSNGELLMNEEEKKQFIRDAELAANVKAIRTMLSNTSYPKDIVSLGFAVVSGEKTADDFYSAVAEFDKSTSVGLVFEAEEEEVVVPVAPVAPSANANEEPWLIKDEESVIANAADFRRV